MEEPEKENSNPEEAMEMGDDVVKDINPLDHQAMDITEESTTADNVEKEDESEISKESAADGIEKEDVAGNTQESAADGIEKEDEVGISQESEKVASDVGDVEDGRDTTEEKTLTGDHKEDETKNDNRDDEKEKSRNTNDSDSDKTIDDASVKTKDTDKIDGNTDAEKDKSNPEEEKLQEEESDSDATLVDKNEEAVPVDDQDLRMREEPRDLEVDVVLNPQDVIEGSAEEDDFSLNEKDQTHTPIKKKSTSLAPAMRKASPPHSENPSAAYQFPKITDKARLEFLMKPFDEGWKRETVIRATSDASLTPNRHSDVYYFTPEGRKLRSRVMVQNYLKDRHIKSLSSENFTFEKRIIYGDPYDIVREAGGRKRPIGVTPKGPFAGSPAKRQKKSSFQKPVVKANVVRTIPKVESVVEKPIVPIKKQPVAKKRTGGGKVQTHFPEKLVKKPLIPVNHLMLEEATLCSLDCEGREGMPPSLHCSVCMCLFHPDCVKFAGKSPSANFVCKSCNGTQPPENGAMNIKISHVMSEASQKTGSALNGSHILSTQSNFMTPAANALSNLSNLVSPASSILVSGNTILPQSSSELSRGNVSFASRQAPVLSLQPKPTEPVTLTLQRPPPPLLKAPNKSYFIKPPGGVERQSNTACNMVMRSKPLATLPVEPDLNNISGQIITLPMSMQKQIQTNKTLTLKMNGQSILVPPTCIVKTPEGIKVFLPPNSLPNVHPVKVVGHTNTVTPTKPSTKTEQLGVISPIIVPDSPPKKTKKTHAKTLHLINMCNFSMLNAGVDSLLSIFKYLNAPDLARAARVCRTWRHVTSIPSLWKTVRLKGNKVSDWESAAKKFNYFHSSVLDMKGLIHIEDSNRTWHQFRSVLEKLTKIRKIDFGNVPASILHAVANKLTKLEVLNAEHITDVSGEQMLNTKSKLDLDTFGNLTALQQLRLKGVGGISMHPCSNGGDLTALKNLKYLSLTTLRDFPSEKFTFLGALTNLEKLEIGECTLWNSEIYALLGSLYQLVTLRLECGGDTVGTGLAEALMKLEKLLTLELINFKVTENVSDVLKTMSHVEALSIWPDNSSEAPRVNTNVLNAVKEMPFLKSFEWGILQDNSQNQENGDQSPPGSTIPFMPQIPNPAQESDDVVQIDHLSISAVGEKLKTCISSTKICVFRVPALAAHRLLRNT